MPDVQDDLAAALGLMRTAAARAVDRRAEVICFPEAFLNGYTVEREIAERRAVSLTSTRFQAALRELAACKAALVFGLIEREDERLFNTAVVVKAGRVRGVYRKRRPWEGCFTAGQTLPVFTIGRLRFGVGICSDTRNANDAAALAARRVDAVLYPLNNLLPDDVAFRWRHRHALILGERARQTGAWVISADVVAHRDGRTGYGCTAAVDPSGAIRDRVDELTTGLALAHVALRSAP